MLPFKILLTLLILLIGGTVIAGWFLENKTMIMIDTSYYPMTFNTALLLIAIASSILFLSFGFRKAAVAIALLSLFISILFFTESLFDTKLGIDELLFSSDLFPESYFTQRPAMNTSLSTLLLSLGILLLSPLSPSPLVAILVGVLAAVPFTFSLVAAYGYLGDLMPAVFSFDMTQMALNTALALFLGSVALLILSFEKIQKHTAYRPFFAGLITLALSLGTTYALYSSWQKGTAINLSQYLESQLNAIARLTEANLNEQLTSPKTLFSKLFGKDAPLAELTVSSDGKILFSQKPASRSILEKETTFIVKGLPVTIKMGLTEQFYNRISGSMQKLFLFTGTLFSLFFALAAYLAELYRENNRQLILANETRSTFFTNVSHELRTPLHGIVAATSLLQKDKFEKIERRIEIITLSAKKLQRLLSNLIDVTKLETESFNIILEKCNINQTVEGLLSPFRSEAGNKKITLISSTENLTGRDLLIAIHPLTLILTNLIDNAIRFTEAGTVTLSIKVVPTDEEQALLHIEVKDSGDGIPKEARDSLFQKTSSLFLGSHQKGSGAKIGLYLSKQLIDKMNGTIRFDTKEGVGSTFYVDIPVTFAKVIAVAK